jgi:hypothetical protein
MEQVTYVGAEGEIRLVDADGTDDRALVEEPCGTSPLANAHSLAWSSDGMHLAYVCAQPDLLNREIVVVDTDGDEIQRLLASRFKWSPDGEKIALERERAAADRGYVIEVLDVVTGGTVRAADDGLLMEWVGGDAVLVGLEPEFFGLGVTFRAHVAEAGTGDSGPLPRFDGARDFWVAPDGARAIVLTEWSVEHGGLGMAVYDFATGEETEITGGYIGYGSETIPDTLLAFSRDGSTIYWANGNDIPDVPFWPTSLLYDQPLAVELTRLPGFGPVSPEGRVAYLDRTSGDTGAWVVADLITGSRVEVAMNFGKAEVAWRTPPLETEFADELQAAIEANDLEYIFQRAHYGEFDCRDSGGLPVGPRNCLLQPMELMVPAIRYGIWNSEGGYYSPEQYAEFVQDRFAAKAAPDAHIYALGRHIRGASEGDGGVDIVVANVSSPLGDDQALAPAVVFRVAVAEGRWSIVGVKIALVELIDDFFDWWVRWGEAFPRVSGG